ncbi:hypothetical protein BC941DRAFT_422850, partial [Chlamydoabsidia padenii]
MMIWSNTSVLDTFNTTFVMIQTLFFLLIPITYAVPFPMIGHLNQVAYQCALLWTLIYALYPR